MTTLLVEPLINQLSQTFRFNFNKRYNIGMIAPYLFMSNSPMGTFSISVIKDGETLLSHAFTSDDLKSKLQTANNYLHLFYPIDMALPLVMDCGEFTIKLAASGYLPTRDSCIGWIRQHENLNNKLDYSPLSDAQNPLAVRIKEFKQGVL